MLKKIVKTSLLLFWLGLIFILSSEPASFFPAVFSDVENALMHIFLYAVLAYLAVAAAEQWFSVKSFNRIFLFSIFFSVFYGITDEYHQSFVPGRSASLIDIMFDAAGAVSGAGIFYFTRIKKKPKLLLHACCMGCGAYVSKLLAEQGYKITVYFYNPNIFPASEYEKRRAEAKRIAREFKLKFIAGDYNHDKWLQLVRGREHDPERGERCLICYKERMEAAAKLAKEKNFEYFATTLSISPHKASGAISEIGGNLEKERGVKFFDFDFKKDDGFRKSCALAKELGLYRQNYCGCEYSRQSIAP